MVTVSVAVFFSTLATIPPNHFKGEGVIFQSAIMMNLRVKAREVVHDADFGAVSVGMN